MRWHRCVWLGETDSAENGFWGLTLTSSALTGFGSISFLLLSVSSSGGERLQPKQARLYSSLTPSMQTEAGRGSWHIAHSMGRW